MSMIETITATPRRDTDLWDRITTAHVYRATDLVHQMVQAATDGSLDIRSRTLGRLSPPFERIWIEWKAKGQAVGSLLEWTGDCENGWVINGETWAASQNEQGQHGYLHVAAWSVRVADNGRFIEWGLDGGNELARELWVWMVYPCLMVVTLSQMGTKYVSITEPSAGRRKKLAAQGRPVIMYREVRLPRPSIKYATARAGTHESPALHWVNGHWKHDYTTYVEPYLRGDASKGFCHTSYKA